MIRMRNCQLAIIIRLEMVSGVENEELEMVSSNDQVLSVI
jgi:hypothetical protein